MSDTLTKWINDQLIERGWTMRELARRSRLSSGYVSDVLAGKKAPGDKFFLGVSHGLEVPIKKLEEINSLNPKTKLLDNPKLKETTMTGKYKYDPNQTPEVNLALALYAIANELNELNRLGSSGEEPSHPGPIEGLTMALQDGFKELAQSIDQLGN